MAHADAGLLIFGKSAIRTGAPGENHGNNSQSDGRGFMVAERSHDFCFHVVAFFARGQGTPPDIPSQGRAATRATRGEGPPLLRPENCRCTWAGRSANDIASCISVAGGRIRHHHPAGHRL